MEIIIYGKSGKFTKDFNDEYLDCNTDDLMYLDDAECQDCFSDYFDDDFLSNKVTGDICHSMLKITHQWLKYLIN